MHLCGINQLEELSLNMLIQFVNIVQTLIQLTTYVCVAFVIPFI